MRVLRTYCHVGPAGLYRALDSGRDFLRVAGRKYHSSELSVSAINIPGKILNGARVPFRGYYGARASKYLHAEPQESIETYSRSPLQQTEVTFSGSGGRSTGSAGWFRYREVESKRGTGPGTRSRIMTAAIRSTGKTWQIYRGGALVDPKKTVEERQSGGHFWTVDSIFGESLSDPSQPEF